MGFEESVKNLSGYSNEKFPVTTLYLKLGPRERENFGYKITLKNLAKGLRDEIGKSGLPKEALESVESDLSKIQSFIDNQDELTECRGLALFSCSGGRFWEALKLPSLDRNQLLIDRAPVLGQVFKSDDDNSHIVTVLIDRKKARIFSIGLDGAEEILDYFEPSAERSTKFHNPQGKYTKKTAPVSTFRSLTQGFGEFSFNRMIENEIHKHFKYVAQMLKDYCRNEKVNWLVLGGTEENVTEFSHHLPTDLRDKLAGSVNIDLERVKPSLVAEVSLDVLEKTRAGRQKKLLQEFADKLPVGYAVDGLRGTLDALRNGQVRVLFVEDGFKQPGFLCPDTGDYLIDAGGKCPGGGEPVPVADLVERAIEEAFGQGAEVEIIQDEPYKKQIHGTGAILRFKL
jgi:peptide subunit release factor 1 (eRF1)